MSRQLINLRPQQEEFFRCGYKHAFALHRRRAGKSYLIAARCLYRMLRKPGTSCFIASASISTGQENILKLAEIWFSLVRFLRENAAANGCRFEADTDDGKGGMLDLDALQNLFVNSKLGARIYFDRTRYSRVTLLAANPRTARGFGGHVYLDESCFVEDYWGVMDAIEPIQNDNPDYELWEFSSPPSDDRHPLYAMLIPPSNLQFTPNPQGNWYRTEQGIPVHRFDAFDGELAGMKFYSSIDGRTLGVAEARTEAIDKAAFDRNYLLLFSSVSVSAISRDKLISAQQRGKALDCIAVDAMADTVTEDKIVDLIPDNIAPLLSSARTGLGYDVASSIEGKANPSAIACIRSDVSFSMPYLIRWRTKDTRVNHAILRRLIDMIPPGRRQGLSIDSSNEALAAEDVRREFASSLPVHLVKGGGTLNYQGQDYKAKTLMGNLYANLFEDGTIAIPPDQFVFDDHRQVQRNGSEFFAPVAPDGAHADCFDAGKHGLWTFKASAGPIKIEAVDTVGGGSGRRRPWETPLMQRLNRNKRSLY